MITETPQWKLAIEVHPEGWRFPTGITWLAGWIWSPQNRIASDLRAWVDGRCFLANWGLPKPGLDEVYLKRPGPPFLGFTLALEPHAGAAMLRLEVRDQSNQWHEVYRTAITVDSSAPGAPPPTSLVRLIPALTNPLLRLQQRRPSMPLAALADEIIAGAIAEPRNVLPGPPFFGALEAPREVGWVRYGRVSITGWLAHREQRIKRITGVVDPLHVGSLLYGLPRTDINGEFSDLAGRESSAFVGHLDLPADCAVPVLLKLFAELDNGEQHLVFAQRFTPRILAGAEPNLPHRSWGVFLRGIQALCASAKRHGLPRAGWRELWPAVRQAWRNFSAEAPASSGRMRLANAKLPVRRRDEPLRVLIATHNLNFEGAPWFIFELARYLAQQTGISVRVVSPQDGPMCNVFEKAGMPVTLIELGHALSAETATDFSSRLDSATAGLPWDQTDLVIANTMVSFWAIRTAHARKLPSLFYIHESSPVRRFFKKDLAAEVLPLVEEAFRLSNRVVFTADSSRRVFNDLGDKGNFVLLPSWVGTKRIDAFIDANPVPGLRSKHRLDPEAVLVINVGSVCERKGQHIFIQAVDLLRSELPVLYPGKKIQFLMVGARPGLFLETLKDEIARLGLEDLAIFLPETGDIFDFYRMADVFTCTSFEESFPRVILESAVFSRLIVTTDVNGIAEMISPDDGWLIPPGDRYRLADALKQALQAHFMQDRTRAQKARASVLRHYNEVHSLPQHLQLARGVSELPH